MKTRYGIAIICFWLSAFGAPFAQGDNALLDMQVPHAPAIAKIDGRPYLVYELHLTNFGSTAMTLARIDLLSAGTVLYSYQGIELNRNVSRVGARDAAPVPTIEPGRRSILYVWSPVPEGREPSDITHRVAFRTAEGVEREVDGARVPIVTKAPVPLRPPLRGGPWAAIYDPALRNGHRRVVSTIDGRARIPARFAIDWVKLGPDGTFSHGDPSVPANSYGYGEEVLAVADGVVAAVENDLPEPTPDISVANEAGNYVSLDLGGNRFAVYEHLKPGSIRVKPGERVSAGQVLAAVGASGSVSSGAHLHFHLADASAPQASEGLPFVLTGYRRLGAFASFEALARPWAASDRQAPARQSSTMPAPLTVVQFN